MLLQRNACAALIATAELEASTLQARLHQWGQAVSWNACLAARSKLDCRSGFACLTETYLAAENSLPASCS